jgi:hypothetical protein
VTFGPNQAPGLPLLGSKPALARDQSLMDGVNAGRKTIPWARFDRTRTKQGVECLRSYRTDWDEKARAFKLTPAHNWASHGADGWRYLSISWRAPTREPEPQQKPVGIPLEPIPFRLAHILRPRNSFAHSRGEKRSRHWPMARQRPSTVLSAAFRNRALSLAKSFSIGLKSGP